MIKYTNIELMSRCESEDFQRTSDILERLFQGRLRNLRPTPSGTSVDLRFEALNKKGKVIKYAVEIKRNNGKYISSNKTLPLKVDKYISMQKERKQDERLIIIYLLPNSFICFNVDKVITDIPMKDLNMTNWLIPLENYSTRDSVKVPQPTIWLNTDKCSISGYTKK